MENSNSNLAFIMDSYKLEYKELYPLNTVKVYNIFTPRKEEKMENPFTPEIVKQLIENVRKLAEQYPDAVYTKEEGQNFCSYVQGSVTNCPDKGCIFGQAAKMIGGEVYEYIKYVDTMTMRGLAGGSIHEVIKNHSYNQVKWCSHVQIFQDLGNTWSLVVKLANEKYPSV